MLSEYTYSSLVLNTLTSGLFAYILGAVFNVVYSRVSPTPLSTAKLTRKKF